MANVVFILGAGASAEGGCPCMCDFFERARILNEYGQLGTYATDFEAVERFRSLLLRALAKTRFDIKNLESVFNAIELADAIEGLGEMDVSGVKSVRESLIRLIVATLERTQLFHFRQNDALAAANPERRVQLVHRLDCYVPDGPTGFPGFARFLRLLATDTPRHNVSVLTFNYDCGLEFSMEYSGCQYSYALTDDCRADAIPIYKLHGSVNWARTADGVVPLKWPAFPTTPRDVDVPNVLAADGRYARPIQILGSESFRERASEVGAESSLPFIIPPSERKADQRHAVTKLWARAFTSLAKAECVFVIGYSLPRTDEFFRQLFVLASTSPTLLRRFYVFDPDPHVQERYEEFLTSGHCEFVFRPFRFTDATAFLADMYRKADGAI